MSLPVVTALIFMKHHSERVPGKNIRSFDGKPLFFWILETLEKSKYIKETIINTDSEEIAEMASKNFNVTIHMRPDYLLEINSNEANQIIEYDLNKHNGEIYLQTHSTNPILSASTIDSAIEAFVAQDEYDSLMSVTKIKKRFYWSNGIPVNHNPKHMVKTQELPPLFEENSCIYMFTKSKFLKLKNRVGENPMFFPINPVESIDIDEEVDFLIAESVKKSLTTYHKI